VRAAVILGTNLAIATVALAWLLARHGAAALALLAASPSPVRLLAFVVSVAAGFATFAWRWRVLLDGLGERVGLGPLTADRAAGHSLSTLLPSARLAGEPLRAWLLTQRRVQPAGAIASVAADRTLEMGASAMFAAVFSTVLVQQGIPALRGALVTTAAGVIGLAVGIALTVRRLRRGQGLLTDVAHGTGLTRFALVRNRLATLKAAEVALAGLVGQPGRLAGAFGIGLAANLVVMLEYWLLLSAFRLPAGPVPVVAALFAAGAAHSMPVPAGIGVLEGGQAWLFSMLGYPADVGLAVGLAVRLRELLCTLPGMVYLGWRMLRVGVVEGRLRRPQNAAPRNPA
jgi:uncharacterized protein (TIRG00374 family)